MSTPTTNPERELKINRRLMAIHDRIQKLADAETRAAWVNGAAADGRFWADKVHLLDEAEDLLSELEKIGGTPAFVPPGEPL